MPTSPWSQGVNHFENCKTIRKKLWDKMHQPNYGAPGPPRSSAKFMTAIPPRAEEEE